MAPAELLLRARAYVDQAVGRLTELEGVVTVPPDQAGVLVSLRANIMSAAADLAELARVA